MIRHAPRDHAALRFTDRRHAGGLLGEAVARLRIPPPVLVLGLPRGGVPVAFEVAGAIDAPLDVMTVRKIGMPGQPELAIGAVATGDVVVHEPGAAPFLPSLEPPFTQLAAAARRELRRREGFYRRGLPPLDLTGRNVVLVDDGIATGATMLAALRAARKRNAASVIVAAPVASPEAAARLAAEADQVVILEKPQILFAIGEWYDRFEQLEDIEVCELLTHAARRHPFKPPAAR
ncbi:MAG TPA: phosphoribosyltransferase family protein [Steroidobacteraceae bacterium]|jgi:predicted phosphoribosyltransferase|nr:phosphoribosyltransferase family protein [Steroidobacteraceae bacterium]